MSPKAIQIRLGVGTCVMALFLMFVGIPYWVSSPSNVSNIVLSPTFWPYVLTAIAGLSGVALFFAGLREKDTQESEERGAHETAPWIRLVALAVIMVITMFALPRLGMVWTTMLVFASTAFLFRTRHPRTAIACALLIPLGLYLFFAHVAGVAIPQGNLVRLP